MILKKTLSFAILFTLSSVMSCMLHAATLTVCSSGCDYTTIQAAHNAANPSDIIEVQENVQTEYGITISKDLSILGQDQSSTIVQAAGTPETALDRVFNINAGTIVTIRDMTIRHGYIDASTVGTDAMGGGLYNDGTVILLNVTLSYNKVFSDDNMDYNSKGGAIYNNGQMTISSCDIKQNTTHIVSLCAAEGEGGGIYNNNNATMIISDSSIINNSALAQFENTSYAEGGGIANDGTLTISNCTISGNNASGTDAISLESSNALGGGVCNWGVGSFTIINSSITNNSAKGGDSYFEYVGSGFGGGIFGGPGEIDRCTISGNSCEGGTIHWESMIYEYPGGPAQGGGISGSNITIRNSTISGNSATGGDGCNDGGDAYGGGINGKVSLINTTIIGNDVEPGVAYGSGYGQGSAYGSGIYSTSPDFSLNNSIVWNECDGENIMSEDYNLLMYSSGIQGITTHNIYGLNPLLGPLTNNGGPTLTHALEVGSPAIDAGSCSVGNQYNDQRGYMRPYDDSGVTNVDDGCDIGAYELNASPPVPTVTTLWAMVLVLILSIFLFFREFQ